MRKLLNVIKRNKILFIALGVSFLVFILSAAILLPAMHRYTGSHRIPDSTFFLTLSKLKEVFNSYSKSDINHYVLSKASFDFIWPIIYSTFFFILITALEKISNVIREVRSIKYVVILVYFLDIMENIFFATYTHSTSDIIGVLGIIFQTLKWIFIFFILLWTTQLIVLSVLNLVREDQKVKIKKTKDYYHIETRIVIDRPIKDVWRIMTDFRNYSWSSTLKSLEEVRGNKVDIVWNFMGSKMKMTKKGKIDVKKKEFWWSGKTSKKSDVIDHHRFILSPQGKKTLLVQSDEFKGKRTLTEFFSTILVKGQYTKYNRQLKTYTNKLTSKK